jgi:hypothetical protein
VRLRHEGIGGIVGREGSEAAYILVIVIIVDWCGICAMAWIRGQPVIP